MCPTTQLTKLVNRVIVTHALVTLGANWPQIIYIIRPTLTYWDVVTHLKVEWRDGILTPLDLALMIENLSTVNDPYLLSYRFWNGFAHY